MRWFSPDILTITITPKSKIEEMNNARKEDAYKHHEIYASAFGSVSIGAFR